MKKVVFIIIVFCVLGFSFRFFFKKEKPNLMINLIDKDIKEVEEYAKSNNLILETEYVYNTNKKNTVVSQSIKENEKIEDNSTLKVEVSYGFDINKLQEDKINELGEVPIMMYHSIINKKDSETPYIGGNVDKDGYSRTSESFRRDLEFYYQNNYRMVRLEDYVQGIIKVEYGKSPIVLTFDDGYDNNIKVIGLDEKGDIIIDPESAVGILEEFKKKYPDFNVTATFFITNNLFNQKEYNEKILKWLVDNGYDIGNHTKSHNDLANISETSTQEVISSVYKNLDNIIKDKYVHIVALPYGKPYNKNNNNFKYVLNGTYDNYSYNTIAALRVGWTSEVSPFHTSFDKEYLKRCRAYDNNGKEFDIEMVFKNLNNTKYISDGYEEIITIPSNLENKLIKNDKKVIQY